jgi:protein farnesyltransferase subunit beta
MFDDANVDTFSSRAIPDLFRHPPIVQDLLRTHTSIEQDKVVHSCLQLLADPLNPLPDLKRDAHVDFLNWALGIDKDGEQLPKGFTKMDASRPWLLYWCLAGLYALGEDLTQYRPRLVSTLRSIQNPDGGFGGGNGQISHLAPTYAAVMSLVMVGGKDALDLVDRKSMWRFITSMKKPHGGFSMCKNGEEDVRGVYCALSVIALLQLPLDMPGGEIGGLVEGTAEYIGRCQTYEGGLAGAPGGLEAHGGYIFCGLASLSILGPPWEMFQK